MGEQIRKIVIVGGGTAGWLSAAYLNRALAGNVDITLIESSDVDPIGVGEATIPSLTFTMKFLGFEEHEWMPEIQATYKAAIKFVGWSPSVRDYYWHSFSPRPEPLASPYADPYFLEVGQGFSMMHYALQRRLKGDSAELQSMILPTNALCEAQRSPIHPTESRFNARSAYHLDAGLLARFLRKVSTERGVEQVVGHVAEVGRDERGFITKVTTRDGRAFSGDLFIDCTGFRGVLINDALEIGFERDNHRLLCDSAVAIPCTSDPESEGINPYTISTAQKHGWSWDVPLMHRNGTGYVYCSDFTTAGEAEEEFRAFLGPRGAEGRANHLKMRVGRSQKFWHKNCVAIGLSAAFLEPLESTGIFFIEYGLANLVTLFPTRDVEDIFARKYNKNMHAMYEETRDFLILHYYINKRNDTEFWRACRSESTVPDSLRERLELFRHSLPVMDPVGFVMFKTLSYTAILDGNGELPKTNSPILSHTGFRAGEDAMERARALTVEALANMPSHYDRLKAMYGRTAADHAAE